MAAAFERLARGCRLVGLGAAAAAGVAVPVMQCRKKTFIIIYMLC